MKAVRDREVSVTSLLSRSRRWGPSTAARLEELLRSELAEGETLPDLEILQELFRRALARRWRRLATAEETHHKARERRREALADLDDAVRGLYRRMVDLRRILKGVFGVAASRRLLSLRGDTSRDPVVLLRQAARAAARLRIGLDPCRRPPASPVSDSGFAGRSRSRLPSTTCVPSSPVHRLPPRRSKVLGSCCGNRWQRTIRRSCGSRAGSKAATRRPAATTGPGPLARPAGVKGCCSKR